MDETVYSEAYAWQPETINRNECNNSKILKTIQQQNSLRTLKSKQGMATN